jgi:hypothetical protein
MTPCIRGASQSLLGILDGSPESPTTKCEARPAKRAARCGGLRPVFGGHDSPRVSLSSRWINTTANTETYSFSSATARSSCTSVRSILEALLPARTTRARRRPLSSAAAAAAAASDALRLCRRQCRLGVRPAAGSSMQMASSIVAPASAAVVVVGNTAKTAEVLMQLRRLVATTSVDLPLCPLPSLRRTSFVLSSQPSLSYRAIAGWQQFGSSPRVGLTDECLTGRSPLTATALMTKNNLYGARHVVLLAGMTIGSVTICVRVVRGVRVNRLA